MQLCVLQNSVLISMYIWNIAIHTTLLIQLVKTQDPPFLTFTFMGRRSAAICYADWIYCQGY